MDINPLAEGHVLLIPREHYATVDRIPSETAGAMLGNLPAIGRAVQQATGCEGFNVLQNNGKVAHQEVMHVHFHVIPRNGGDEFRFNWPAGSYPEGRCAELAESIRKQLS
jgi:histidine triad (HIT) family protein